MTSINDMVEPHRSRLATLSNQELLDSLSTLEPLPDESDPGWDDADSTLWDRTGEFLAYADEVAGRRLIEGVGLVLERACFGDPGEMMRGLRHSLEHAVNGDWDRLAAICASALTSGRAGTRLWAVNELAILRDPSSVDVLVRALGDGEAAIRSETCLAAEMLAQQHPVVAASLLPILVSLAAGDEDAGVRRRAERAVAQLQASDAVEPSADS